MEFYSNLNKKQKPPPISLYTKIVENLNNKQQHQTLDKIQFAAEQLTSFWHIQNFERDDEELFEHYLEVEDKYTFTYMVPFPFLQKVPQRNRPWEICHRDVSVDDGIDDKIDKFNEDYISSYDEWVRDMEVKVNGKREEELHTSVTIL